jgi:hypothetical protein
VFRLIRVFSKAMREGGFGAGLIQTNRVTSDLSAKTDPVLDSLEAALKLRADYLANGLYLRKEARDVRSSMGHPIHWPKTLRHFPPVLDKGEVFFPDTIHRARRQDPSHSLTALQLACLGEITRLTGEKHLMPKRVSAGGSDYGSVFRTANSVLRRLNSEIYDERGRSLIRMISAYLELGRLKGSKLTERDELLAFTAEFETIWEHILRKLFGDGGESRKLPRGSWWPYPLTSADKGIGPNVDALTKVFGDRVILDAKDYRVFYSSYRRFGQEDDYYKQTIYGLLVGAREAGSKPLNILLFPGIDQKHLFRINGCHQWKDIPGSLIFEATVDYTMAVQAWLGERRIDTKAELEKLVTELKLFKAALPSVV